MGDWAIRTDDLGKRYRLGAKGSATGRLTEAIYSAVRRPFQRRSNDGRTFWALRGVTLEVSAGAAVGIIGRNGSGKTTLLKVLSRITEPTEGYAALKGRVGSLLEVGTGFHPDLTGRENVYLNGAILGMGRSEISRKFDEIVAFAEVERFLDTQVKFYSSGMYLRLAFAVAAHLEPEILLVDEVLAVGDLAFQKKCLGKMSEVANIGRTVLFVSHQMHQVRRLCNTAVWLDAGQVRSEGSAPEVLAAYEQAVLSPPEQDQAALGSRTKAAFVSWHIVHPDDADPHMLSTLGEVEVRFVFRVPTNTKFQDHGISLRDAEGTLIWGWASRSFSVDEGMHYLSYTFPMLPLRAGVYSWQLSLFDDEGIVDSWHAVPDMVVATESVQHYLDAYNGVLNIPSQFRVDDGA